MAIEQTYHTFEKHIRHMLTVNHKSRIRNLAWMMTGILFSRSVHLSFIAKEIPGPTERRSRTRRISRFLHNVHFRVRDWYKLVTEHLLIEAAGSRRPIQLIIDATKVTNNYQLPYRCYRFSRARPARGLDLDSPQEGSQLRSQTEGLAELCLSADY